MHKINFGGNKVYYKCYLQDSIACIKSLIEKEQANMLYYDRLSDCSTKDYEKDILKLIAIDERHHMENLKRLYLEITSKSPQSDSKDISLESSYLSSVLKCQLGKFESIRIYNSLFDTLVDIAHKNLILSIINEELSHVGELNFILINNK